MSLLIIDNYDSFTYNLVQCVEQSGIEDYVLAKNDQLGTVRPEQFEKVLISPGPGVVSETGQLFRFIEKYHKEKSFLGICLGFEALLEFLGAKMAQLPKPMHGIKNEGIILRDDIIFRDLPRKFNIGHYHSWYVKEVDFPKETQILMKDSNGLIMAFRHKKYDLRAVQFHPESYMTEFGCRIITNWLSL